MMIGQYRMLAELGAGGMGIVYHGVDTLLELEVAVKKLRSEFARGGDVAERFRREAKIQARLNHPNLARLYTFFKEEDAFYIVMEFVDGAPLGSLLPLHWTQVLPIYLQVLDALQFAHSQGVLHRDVKPDNIMVSPRGEVKVMDFGISHVLGQARQTREKTIVGTLEYIPPEQISGKEIGPWSDIYSLGALLYETMTARPPFETESEFALLQMHLDAPPPDLNEAVPDAPPFLAYAIRTAMAKDPQQRFASCQAMADFLRQSAPHAVTPTGQLRHVTEAEVERSVRRMDSLLSGGEIDLAALVAGRAALDYPGHPRIAQSSAKVERARAARAQGARSEEKMAFLDATLKQLAEMEQAGDIRGAILAADAALEKFPRLPALQIAAVHLRGKPSA
jgi:serine/threonine-protein kinase